MAALEAMSTRRDLPESPYLAAATGRKPSRVPVWFMRQAGRSLPEYRALRAKNTMMQACFDAELITEITLQPVRRHGVDAAILFSDIVVPLRASGIELDIVPDVGPVIAHPIRTAADVAAMKPLEREQVAPVAEAVSLLVSALGDVPLIGFAGAPFTLASYLVEGGPSRNHERTKAMMLGEPAHLACVDDSADRRHDRFPAGPAGRRGGRDPAVRLVGGHAVARRLPQLRAAAQHPGVRRAGRRRRADDALRGRHRRTARRDVARPVPGHRRRRGGLADVADRCRRRVRPGIALAGQPRSGGAAGGLAGGGARGARRRRGRPPRGRRRRGRPRVQPRPRRAARHRSRRR